MRGRLIYLLSFVHVCRSQDSETLTTTVQMNISQLTHNGTDSTTGSTNSSLDTSPPVDSQAPAGVDTIVPTRAPVETWVNNTFILSNALALNASMIATGAHMQLLSQGYTYYVVQQLQAFFDALANDGSRQRRLQQSAIMGSLDYAEGSAAIDRMEDIPCMSPITGTCQQAYSSFAVIVDTIGADKWGSVYQLAQQFADELANQTQSNVLSSQNGLAQSLRALDGESIFQVYAVRVEESIAPSSSPSAAPVVSQTNSPTASPTWADTLVPSSSPSSRAFYTLSPSLSPTSSPVAVLSFGSNPTLLPTVATFISPPEAAAATVSTRATSFEQSRPLVAGMASLLCIAMALCIIAAVLFVRRKRDRNFAKTRAIDDNDDDAFSISSFSIPRNKHDSRNIVDAYLCDGELHPMGFDKSSSKASLRNLAMFEERLDNSECYKTSSHVQFLAGILNFDLPRQGSSGMAIDEANGNPADEQLIT